jgi:hypothetical protein
MLRCVICASSTALRTPPLELLDALEQLLLVARVAKAVQGRERIHQHDEIGRLELLDEALQRAAQRDGDGRMPVDVIVVQEDRKQPYVVLGGLDKGLAHATNLERFAVIDLPVSVEPDELHRLHGLRDVVLGDHEVGGLQIQDGLVVSAGHPDVDANQLRPGPEDRLLGLTCRLLCLRVCRRALRRRRLLRGRLLGGERCRHHQHGEQQTWQGSGHAVC